MKEYTYLSIRDNSEASVEIKRSVFIGRAFHVESEEAARAALAEIKKAEFRATHNCYAYCLYGGESRSSDDGEPGGTAGAPILGVLTKQGLSDVLLVVTRYFGGIKLGAGGLVRAYSQCAAECLAKAALIERIPGVIVRFSCEYAFYPRLCAYAATKDIALEADFGEAINAKMRVSREIAEKIVADITDLSKGAVRGEVIGECTLESEVTI